MNALMGYNCECIYNINFQKWNCSVKEHRWILFAKLFFIKVLLFYNSSNSYTLFFLILVSEKTWFLLIWEKYYLSVCRSLVLLIFSEFKHIFICKTNLSFSSLFKLLKLNRRWKYFYSLLFSFDFYIFYFILHNFFFVPLILDQTSG